MDFKFEFDADKLTWGELELLQERDVFTLSETRGIISKMLVSVDGKPLSTEGASEAIKALTGKERRALIESFQKIVRAAQDEAVSPPTASS